MATAKTPETKLKPTIKKTTARKVSAPAKSQTAMEEDTDSDRQKLRDDVKKLFLEKGTTSKPSAPKQPKAAKTASRPSVPTPDRVETLLRVFKDATDSKAVSADYKAEQPTASDLHWWAAREFESRHQKLRPKELSGLTAAIKASIKKVGSVDPLNHLNETPLHWAVVNKMLEVVELLVANGANVNAMAAGGTPLHYATARGGDSTISEFLLKAGADSTVPNGQKKLPIVFVPPTLKKYFSQAIEDAKVHILRTAFAQGKTPTLNKEEMGNAIDAALEYRKASLEYENTPNYWLQTNGVMTVRGVPTCNDCKKSFTNDKDYAKHILSVEHIVHKHRTTLESMHEAKAFLEFKGIFHDVYLRNKTKEDALKGDF